MSKNQKIHNLTTAISIKSQRIEYLLENITIKAEGGIESQIFAEIALDEAKKMSRMLKKISRILKNYKSKKIKIIS